MRLLLPASVLSLLALILVPGSALAAERTTTVPASYHLHTGHPPTSQSSCKNTVFAQWVHVPGTTAARIAKTAEAPSGWRDVTGKPPFDNHFALSGDGDWFVDAPAGHDWMKVGQNGRFSFNPNAVVDCTPNIDGLMNAIRVGYTPNPTVELTVTVKDARILGYKSKVRLDKNKRAAIARVKCPKGGLCKLKLPKNAYITISKHRYKLPVIAPKKVGGGKTGTIRVRMPLAARNALGKRSTRVRIKISATRQGSTVTSTRSRLVRR